MLVQDAQPRPKRLVNRPRSPSSQPDEGSESEEGAAVRLERRLLLADHVLFLLERTGNPRQGDFLLFYLHAQGRVLHAQSRVLLAQSNIVRLESLDCP